MIKGLSFGRGTGREAAAAVVLTVVVGAASVYANLAFAVRHPADYRYFPPFERNVNANLNRHLGHEYFHIARALAAGKGFADPFGDPTGPTAWMPPVLPALLAVLLWACDGNADAVLLIVVCLKVVVLVGTGLLVLALLRQTTRRVGVAVATAVFLVTLLAQFRQWFQFANDSWLLLLAVDLLLAGLCWLRPLHSAKAAAAWGLFGGLGALASPVLGLTWAVMSCLTGFRERT
jgi:hypothetical protein